MRALLFFVFILVIYLVIRFTLKRLQALRTTLATEDARQNKPETQEMVACETCGLHLPKNEAICEVSKAGNRYFCSTDHQERAHNKG